MTVGISGAGKTIGALRRALARRLARELPAGQREAAALDARLLTAAAFGVDAADLLRDDETLAGEAEAGRLEAMAIRRLAGEPVARILGRKEFWSLTLELTPDTLIPRPDTETLVGAALEAARGMAGPLRILDIGTGSGAILLSLLTELPAAFGVGTDRAPGALRAASANAAALGLQRRSGFVLTNWADALIGAFHLVVANPPYIPSSEIAGLDREVRFHDPVLALDGGPDGLDAYRSIVPELARLLATGGRAFLEVGAGQAEAVSEIAERQSYSYFVHEDLAGLGRVVEAWIEK